MKLTIPLGTTGERQESDEPEPCGGCGSLTHSFGRCPFYFGNWADMAVDLRPDAEAQSDD